MLPGHVIDSCTSRVEFDSVSFPMLQDSMLYLINCYNTEALRKWRCFLIQTSSNTFV